MQTTIPKFRKTSNVLLTVVILILLSRLAVAADHDPNQRYLLVRGTMMVGDVMFKVDTATGQTWTYRGFKQPTDGRMWIPDTTYSSKDMGTARRAIKEWQDEQQQSESSK